MKKLTTLSVLILLVAFTAFAAPFRGGKLTIYSHNKEAIRVFVDGKRYSLEYNMLVLNDIEPGNHTIKIVERSSSGYNVPVNREKVLYNGSVFFRTNYHVDIVVNRFGKALVDEQDARNSRLEEDDEYGNNTAMTDAAFESLKKALQQEKFTSSRMTVAKAAITSNYFKTEQVRQLAQFFTFDDDKMQIVKQAYAKTIDRSNYYLLSSLFSFSSNKDELTRFIQENQDRYDNGYQDRTVISDTEFIKLKNNVRFSTSDNSRLMIVKQGIDGSYFTAAQVKELVLLLSYESAQLEIAKYAYGKTVNQADYLLYLNDVFVSKTNKEELSRYVANYR
jgi:hypothetical protein